VTLLSNSSSVIPAEPEPTSLVSISSGSHQQPTSSEEPFAKVQPSSPIPDKPILSDKPTLKCELEVFSSTFLTIFLAELGDKTQLTTLLMSAQSQSPWVVFAGAGAALVLTSLLGILLGRWLATKIAPKTLETSSGVLLLVIAAMLCWDVLRS
jgi:Ca2+/H+ antiporter, TMEM165/GDT1 family